jgi:hypothetical protein
LKTVKYCFIFALLLAFPVLPRVLSQTASAQAKVIPKTSFSPIGRWRVKFTMEGLEKNLIVVSQPHGVASLLLLDTGPDDKPVADPKPAVWSQLTNDRVSFSGEAELPIGTCCREIGTLIFKGKFTSSTAISGKLIFVTSIDEEESPNRLRSVIGTFTATRVESRQQ